VADFFHALTSPEIPFIRYALAAGLASSAAFGVIGTYVVVRRISYIAGAVSHSVLSGIGLGLLLQNRYEILWFTPLLGAVLTAVLSALVIGLVSMYARQREDTVIGAIWAIGMAVGVMLLARTPGYVDPMSYLFGDILIISRSDLYLIVGLDVLVLALGALFYKQLQAVIFDEEFAAVRGLNTGLYYMLLLLLTALTIVLMVTIVGIVMVIAMLTLPAAVGGLFSRRLWQMMILSALFCMLFTALGLTFSYLYDFPTGATIIVVAGGVYIVSIVLKAVWKRLRA